MIACAARYAGQCRDLSMSFRPTALFIVALVAWCASALAQVTVTGRVVDETGGGVAGARVEIRPADEGVPVVVSSDAAGNFSVNLRAAGDYEILAERQGFYVFHARSHRFEASGQQLTIALNHQYACPRQLFPVVYPGLLRASRARSG
jgi:hypothetical protein